MCISVLIPSWVCQGEADKHLVRSLLEATRTFPPSIFFVSNPQSAVSVVTTTVVDRIQSRVRMMVLCMPKMHPDEAYPMKLGALTRCLRSSTVKSELDWFFSREQIVLGQHELNSSTVSEDK